MENVIMCDATEGFYPDRNMFKGVGEMIADPDLSLSDRKVTQHGSMRFCREAFKFAMQRDEKVTAFHKASPYLMTDGLFLERFHGVAKDFREVETQELIVDAFAALVVLAARFIVADEVKDADLLVWVQAVAEHRLVTG